MKKLYFLLFLFCISGYQSIAQLKRNVLFLGNSYTAVNNLPQLVYDVALSTGDTLIFDSNTPGGYTLEGHSLNLTSQNKIKVGEWNYVVIQGQSQEPITSSGDFGAGAFALYTLIKQYNPCAVTMPYMTWGRKNGDANNCGFFPVMCTYEGMDSTLRNTYIDLSKNLNAEVSPVSVVWNYIRQNHPNIELYDADESHPSTAGSYAAAVCFYTSIFKKDPTSITYNFGLSESVANAIKNAVKIKVYDILQTWDFKKMPKAKLNYRIGAGTNEIIFNAISQGVRQNYLWDFGDGTSSNSLYPTHSYTNNGTYTVTLTTSNCDLQGLHTSTADTIVQFCSHTPSVYITNSWMCKTDTLWTELADSYQWYANGIAVPETNRYVANHLRYNTSGFTVRSTVNGCSELSKEFNKSLEWSGYYFDAIGNPCEGDTVAFAVLHTNGALSGLESILWYKNDTLLSAMNNEDTLLITSSGKYECKVIDPNGKCPVDTTAYDITYNCESVGVNPKHKESTLIIFPNPSNEYITVKLSDNSLQETLELYTTLGQVVKSLGISTQTINIDISDLPQGVFYVRIKNKKHFAIKLIKI